VTCVFVVQVVVASGTKWTLVQSSPTGRVCVCVIQRPQEKAV